ncbi:LysR substrate-binding domain-containing protein [Panacagrimonas sp.]|uniref:LysR family transcriptional regulator n=1 Tax=Panacagrimonas sp. TaxID=2480088 RepID=UPI003B52E3CB
MDLVKLQVFVAVTQAGSFTAAADRLALTKSAVSQAVSALERELGIQLLQRSTRRVAITQAGEAFLADCRALLAQAGQMVERARARQGELSGLLRITSSIDAAPFVAPLIAEYAAQHPQMRVEYLPTDELVDLIRENIDLSLRITGVRDSGLRAVGLADMQIWCVASPDYLKAHGTPKHVEDLAAHEWIGFTRLASPWSLRFRVGRRDVTVRVRGRLSTSMTSAGRALAISGAGIVGAPDYTLRADVEAGRLVRLFPDARLPALSLYAAWPGRMEPAAKTRAMIELAKTRLGKRLPADG